VDVDFLTPLGGLFVLTALVPLLVLRSRERHVARLRSVLRLPGPPARSRTALVAALVAACAILALAAAQPVIATARVVEERTDAQVFVVLDTSRSMLAAAGPDEPTRLDRAEAIAKNIARSLPEVPVGLASMTDRLLPHAFPTTNPRVVDETLDKTLSIESPGPTTFFSERATTFDSLTAAPLNGYFPPAAKKRVLVVLSDGESRPITEDIAGAYTRKPDTSVLFVHLWDQDEQVYLAGVPEVTYRTDPASESIVEQVAQAVDGEVFDEGSAEDVPGRIRELIGDGPTANREHEGRRRALMPWVTLLTLIPLAYVLRRRNA
jgi:hypothetical protein